MKDNLPRYLMYVLLGSLCLSVLAALIDGDSGTFAMGLFVTGGYLSPVVFLTLLIHKFITWKIKNNYFYPALGLTITLISVVLYLASHVF